MAAASPWSEGVCHESQRGRRATQDHGISLIMDMKGLRAHGMERANNGMFIMMLSLCVCDPAPTAAPTADQAENLYGPICDAVTELGLD